MMMASTRQPIRAGDDFWRTIECCLVEFHGWESTLAHERVERFKADLAPVRSHGEDDLVLHAEPFDLAGDTAGRYLNLFEHRQRYIAIIDECRRELDAGAGSMSKERVAPNLVGPTVSD